MSCAFQVDVFINVEHIQTDYFFKKNHLLSNKLDVLELLTGSLTSKK